MLHGCIAAVGVTVRNPTSYGIAFCKTSYFPVDDVTFDYTTWNPIPLNLDGVHFDGHCHHGKISNLRGTCFDDIVISDVFAAKVFSPEGIGVNSRTNFPPIWVQGPVDVGSLTIRNLSRDERNIPVATIRVDKDAKVDRLTVRDCKVINRMEKPLAFFDVRGKVSTSTVENNAFISSPGENVQTAPEL